MNKRYKLEGRGNWYVSEMLRQKVSPPGIRIERYEEECIPFKQNNLLKANQKLFYKTLNKCREKNNNTANQTTANKILK